MFDSGKPVEAIGSVLREDTQLAAMLLCGASMGQGGDTGDSQRVRVGKGLRQGFGVDPPAFDPPLTAIASAPVARRPPAEGAHCGRRPGGVKCINKVDTKRATNGALSGHWIGAMCLITLIPSAITMAPLSA